MSYPFIHIQPGTRYIEVGQIPILTSQALYPPSPNDDCGDMTKADWQRGIARVEHEKALEHAENMGIVKPRHPISLVPDSFSLGEHGQKRLVPIDEVQAFAHLLGIMLVPASGKIGEPLGIQYGPMMTIEDIGAVLARQHDIPADAIVASLMEAARDIGVRDPRTGLRANPKAVRAFYDHLAVADVNAWLEGQGVAYRLVLPADDKAQDLPSRAQAVVPAKAPRKRVNAADWDGRKSAVLQALIDCGYDPLNLPMTDAGQDGPTKAVRDRLCDVPGKPFMTGRMVANALRKLREEGLVSGGGLTSVSPPA